jgi:hypothetical protein
MFDWLTMSERQIAKIAGKNVKGRGAKQNKQTALCSGDTEIRERWVVI